jgi:hypothetical protein
MTSWVIVEKSTGKAIYETFNYSLANCFNTDKCEIVPILEYLQTFNKGIKNDQV